MDPLGALGTKLYGARANLGREKWRRFLWELVTDEWEMEEMLEHLCGELSLCGVCSSSMTALSKAPQLR